MTPPRPTPEGALTDVLLHSNSAELFLVGSGNRGLPHKLTGREARALATWLVAQGVGVAPEGRLVWPTDPSYPCPTCGHKVAPEGREPCLIAIEKDTNWAGGWVLHFKDRSVSVAVLANELREHRAGIDVAGFAKSMDEFAARDCTCKQRPGGLCPVHHRAGR